MKTSLFDFDLPDSLIAQNPVEPRDACKLMIVDRQSNSISHTKFFEIGNYLKDGDVLVFNDSKVIPARINFVADGVSAEILLIRNVTGNIWKAIGKPGKLLKPGKKLAINKQLEAIILDKENDGLMTVEFNSLSGNATELLKEAGVAPFPPYISATNASLEDYQTVYAKNEGSVASPTAGLHFTDQLLENLCRNGIQQEFVTLHVGLGTFKPIKTENIEDHVMHSEIYQIDKDTVARLTQARREGRRIIPVGTTSVRVLESYFSTSESDGEPRDVLGETSIYIYPGYKWKCAKAMVTNFHIPRSSLILLVSAFGGQELIFKAYEEAIRYKYRFYSFGDAMLII